MDWKYMAPLAVRVNVVNVMGVRNTDRNKRRIERKLQAGKLTMCLNKAEHISIDWVWSQNNEKEDDPR